MAESIQIHFRGAPQREILHILASFCEAVDDDRRIYFYPERTDYLLLITQYIGYPSEYDVAEQAVIEQALGGHPSASLDIEFRRSKHEIAFDAAESFIIEAFSKHKYIIDDGDKFWTATDLLIRCNFLDNYRLQK